MGKINIKGGTPAGSASICRTCTWAHIMSGYRESELFVVCTNLSPNVVVPFRVVECTAYHDKNRPSWDEMKKLAIEVAPRRLVKPVGFGTRNCETNKASDEDCEEAELVDTTNV